MPEIPKRLAPTRETVRELYLKSGNRCAFPGCNKALFNAKGVFVGHICHIEAAEPGGERFNKHQTNEQRRHPSNLVLMCYDHHVETDDVLKFPVDRMKRIKEEHEKLFSDVIGSMLQTVTDHTTLTEPVFAKDLKKLDQVLSWGNSDEELADALKELKRVTIKLAKVPIPSRGLFLILVNRGKKGRFSDSLEVSVPEVQQATNLAPGELRECFSILDDHGFTYDNDTNDFGVQMVGIASPSSGWPLWVDIKRFCKKEKIDLSQIIINLDFSVLDED
ncbi:hypothetical protein LZ012_13935 [Dechloromonas sp. XY25]|uniref:HNH endonuclease n=1 Tax=Dechloromonas hankyongensis TaxID=2908002 RepID=A0ABS9K4S0_9RHOO|nr:hypothetical protein [Dechloromonas hankyongensis]MCG2578090.1 hypothetical protein [Dechloromonas hankyongensis]